MSKRELLALLKSQERLPVGSTTRSRPQRRAVMSDPEATVGETGETTARKAPDFTLTREVQQLRAQVEELRVQLEEAQTALTASDEQLEKVSGECERVNGEVRAVSELIVGLTGTGPSSLRHVFESFLETQAKLLDRQATAAAVNSAPPLDSFTGEDLESHDHSFERWLTRFEERASMLSWTNELKLYHLKQHLSKTALQVLELLPSSTRSSYSTLVEALKARFKPVDIEKLWGLQFHQLMQTNQSVEKLGLQLMSLARKAFPMLGEKELDRMLKGRFFQALQSKWQRKLGAPKVGESFSDLYDRARTAERHDQHFQTSREGSSQSRKQSTDKRETVTTPKETGEPSRKRVSSLKCFGCGELGHFKRNCPHKDKLSTDISESKGKREYPSQQNRSEAPGSTSTASGSSFSVIEAGSLKLPEASVAALSDEQLESILRQRRCTREQGLLDTSEGKVSAVTGSGSPAAVGPILELDVLVGGVAVAAMIDTGAQSSIVSRSFLHRVGRQLRSKGIPVPKLQPASVRLYGKDGAAGQHELDVTAQVTLPVETGGVVVHTIFFVQPDSTQDCLIGMNAAPALGLSFLDKQGMPLRTTSPDNCNSATVNLVHTKAIPARSHSFVEAEVSAEFVEGACVVFEPDSHCLQRYGVGAVESLVCVNDQRKVLLPVVNYHQSDAHLDRGTVLGHVKLYSECTDSEDAHGVDLVHVPQSGNGSTKQEACIAAVSGDADSQTLLDAVQWPETKDSGELGGLKALVAEYRDIFALTNDELGCTDVVQHRIDTEEHTPIKQYPRRTPFVQRTKIAKLVADMEKKGVISPSKSPWASPVVLVAKKDGSTRFCVDFRRLNAVTKKDVYPLPRIEDILDTLGRARYFSTLDLSTGYWQIPVHPADREKTAFTTHCGLFEFNRMPFGLCNAPSTFQRLMQTVLAGLDGKCCFVYIDDILVCSRTFKEHVKHLKLVFDRLRAAGLRLKVGKCMFLREQVKYLGHTISKEGIGPDPSKVVKVQTFPVPTDVHKLRQFLGLASYYRRFIKDFASVSSPLNALTKKGASFQWTTQCQHSFDRLKTLLCCAPVLLYPKFGPGHDFVLETDASLTGLGAVLSQADEKGVLHPVAYASRALHKHLTTISLKWKH